ncbi:palmitoyltransferase AKR1 NDAI_0H00850 [Naumovozyma dairenensis CBS 421]|uniref:Palmitoyltransferase n=1 Tax=Naumovozyma dairenensis (strain ATCC 10597 / BCRC 20456 / CBS 421 / NBRC 0211 / NRRL Y-12639) TaxID=1071378 RepID=G0WEP8_NAUDC|nr:hypothetical protein NDAI_0H00850 [Naumovozyma dairenensis CBS 421]CCD26259.1 hypothetical protein NDAI_0H00850 [Naumovozyma dairenensis CBS 421]
MTDLHSIDLASSIPEEEVEVTKSQPQAHEGIEQLQSEGQDDANSLSSLKPIISETPKQEEEIESLKGDPVIRQYHVACQTGDLTTVKQLISSGVIDIKHDYDDVAVNDENERTTGLHWASINNRLSVVKYLISQGADVNATTGNLNATPLHWAARYGYVYIVDYLLQHGADPSLCDLQGFNLLHLAINSSNIMLVVYVLFFIVSKNILDVDCQDPHGRTPLLWAAYQGDSLSVAILLKFGASTKITDEGGFTPLHWATVKGQPHVLKYLIRDGADFFKKTNDGKDCFTIAKEMNTEYSLRDSLRTCGFDINGFPIKKYFKTSDHAKMVTFFAPLVLLSTIFLLWSHIHPLFALIVSLLLGLVTIKALKKFVLPSYDDDTIFHKSILKSPFVSGIFFGSVVLLTVVWFFHILPWTIEEGESHVLMAIILFAVFYIFSKLLISDPGCIPPETNHDNIRNIIKELLDVGKFDSKNFCLESWTRKPLRSKYSHLNNALVARFDHFCPWIYNDVGLKNHKNFIGFILLVEAGIITFASLCFEYFDELKDHFEVNENTSCFLLGDNDLCYGFTYDRLTFLILCWSLIQSIWLIILISIQVFQILYGVTNSEFNKYVKDKKRRQDDLHSTINHNEFFNTTPEDLLLNEDDDSDIFDNVSHDRDTSVSTTVPPQNETQMNLQRSKTCFNVCCSVTGMDQLKTVIKETLGIHSISGSRIRPTNLLSSIPTNYGCKRNMLDFWLTSDVMAPLYHRLLFSPTSSKALLNGIEVDYYKLYKFPKKDAPPFEVLGPDVV